MESLAEIIDFLKHSPCLPDVSSELEAILRAEAPKRQRFYADITPEMKAEFIEGEFILHSPARRRHLSSSEKLYVLLTTWVSKNKLGEVHHEKCLCVFPRNDYEPDIAFFGATKVARLDPNTMKFPIPDFIVEVLSESTEKNDRGVKFEDYQAHGVGEYWIIDPVAQIVEQYLLRKGQYELALKSGTGEIASEVIIGFRIPIRAIFDDAENEAALAAQMSA